jgi:hypothetical protein
MGLRWLVVTLEQKYLKCFSQEKSDQLQKTGYEFLYERNGVFYHKNNKNLSIKFSNTDVLTDTKFSCFIGV